MTVYLANINVFVFMMICRVNVAVVGGINKWKYIEHTEFLLFLSMNRICIINFTSKIYSKTHHEDSINYLPWKQGNLAFTIVKF